MIEVRGRTRSRASNKRPPLAGHHDSMGVDAHPARKGRVGNEPNEIIPARPEGGRLCRISKSGLSPEPETRHTLRAHGVHCCNRSEGH
jgi:hypothetical protein